MPITMLIPLIFSAIVAGLTLDIFTALFRLSPGYAIIFIPMVFIVFFLGVVIMLSLAP
jgi:hypothetical protein